VKVIVAEPCGFCAGVKRAVQLAEQSLQQGKNVYSLGPLIHNPQVVERLQKQGLKVTDSLANVPDGAVVLIRSHGEPPQIFHQAQQRSLEVIDGTCVLVRRAQNIVKELQEQGYQVLIVGDPNHPEIRGVMAYAPHAICLSDESDLPKITGHRRLGIIAQTTYSLTAFGKMVGLVVSSGCAEVKVVDTICQATHARQRAALEVTKQVQVMFVLGGRQSANTARLAELCAAQGVNTYHLESWKQFSEEYIQNKTVAGVTAGASTPDWAIEEFVLKLRQK
jgi:4-hydroxy-3-methylbut-2-enyl diphosphate reductase